MNRRDLIQGIIGVAATPIIKTPNAPIKECGGVPSCILVNGKLFAYTVTNKNTITINKAIT